MKRTVLAIALATVLCGVAQAGEIPTTGKAEPTPTPTSSTSTSTTSSSTSTDITTAIILAILRLVR